MENRESIVMVRALTRREFISRARGIHGDLYIYSNLIYINRRTKVEIICQKHGSFMKRPDAHVHQKQGCPKCISAGYSKISIQFLNDLAKDWKVDIQHAENGGEYRIKDSNLGCHYKADGYFELDNIKYMVEFHGDFFHGNPMIYKPDEICKLRGKRYDELYKKTMERMTRLKSLGYTVIYIWERDYKQYLIDRNDYFSEGLLDYYKVL